MSASREKRLRRELREAEANSDTVKKTKKKKQPMSPQKAKKLRSAIGTTVGVLVILAFALLIFVNSGVLQKNATAVTVGSHKLTPTEFNYFYQDTYYNVKSSMSSYWSYMVDTTKPIEDQDCMMSEDGGTWKDYITDSAIASATQMYALYDAAAENGYTIPEEAQTSIDSVAENLESYAKSNGFKDAEDYLEDYYGKGASVESYVDYLTLQQTASGYATEKSESFTYTDDELRTYYNENKQDFDKVTYRVFNVATVDDDSAAAKETADAMQAELDSTEKSFSDAAYKYATEDSKESYEDEDYTLRRNSGYSSLSSDYADWLFDEARVAGESQVFATSSGYAVVMFISRDDNQYNTVDVRHLLIKVAATGEDGTSTDADWEACKEKMDEIQAQWEESDMTEDTFITMAEENSDDSSASNGGLIEDIYKGQMVAEFEDWCFADGRAAGDWGVVKTQYGYHLMYYVGTGDEYWKTLADSSKRSADYSAWYEEYSASYEGKSSFFGQLFTKKELAA